MSLESISLAMRHLMTRAASTWNAVADALCIAITISLGVISLLVDWRYAPFFFVATFVAIRLARGRIR